MTKMRLFAVALAIAILTFSPLSHHVAAQDKEGKIVAEIDFDPGHDGFSFRNYGKKEGADDDLDVGDLIRIFGAENVCIEGSTPSDCELYETAEQWRQDQ